MQCDFCFTHYYIGIVAGFVEPVSVGVKVNKCYRDTDKGDKAGWLYIWVLVNDFVFDVTLLA